LGHLIIVPFDDSFVVQAHPKQDKDKRVSMQKMITHLRIGTTPPFHDVHSLVLCEKLIDQSIVLKNLPIPGFFNTLRDEEIRTTQADKFPKL